MDRIFYMRMALILSLIGVISCSTIPQNAVSETKPKYTPSSTKPIEIISLKGSAFDIWNNLQKLSLAKLNMQLQQAHAASDTAWIKLGIISKQYGANTTELLASLMKWRTEYPEHLGNTLFPENEKLNAFMSPKPRKHVALLLPLQGQLASQGEAVRDGYLGAYYDTLINNTREQTISFFDTGQNKNLNTVYQEAINQGADIIIGPLSKEQVQELSLKGTYPVLTLALNYIDENITDPHLYQFGLSQKDEAEQLADKAIQAGHSRAIIIAAEDSWSQNIVKTITAQWETKGGKIIDHYFYSKKPNFSQDIAHLMGVNPIEDSKQMDDDNTKDILAKQRRQDFDALFLIALPQQGRIIVPLLKYYYADDIPIYSTSIIYSGVPSPQKDKDLNGVIFCDIPWLLTNPSASQYNRLYAVGRDAQLLSNELERLTLLPHFPLQAATGTLSLNAKQQIYRQVSWTKMHAGHP